MLILTATAPKKIFLISYMTSLVCIYFWGIFLTDLCRVILHPLYWTCWSVYTPAGLWYFASHVTSRDTITQTFPGSNFLRAIPYLTGLKKMLVFCYPGFFASGKLVLEILGIFWRHGSKSMVRFSSMMSSLMRVWWLMINGIDSTRKPTAR